MRSTAHDAIRKLLKEFGVTADETVSAYLIEKKPAHTLKLRIVLEDVTEGGASAADRLRVEVQGEIVP
jgi:hypothetical protein